MPGPRHPLPSQFPHLHKFDSHQPTPSLHRPKKGLPNTTERGKNSSMPSSFTPSNPDPEPKLAGDELVRIDKASYKGSFLKFKDRIIDEFRWTLANRVGVPTVAKSGRLFLQRTKVEGSLCERRQDRRRGFENLYASKCRSTSRRTRPCVHSSRT